MTALRSPVDPVMLEARAASFATRSFKGETKLAGLRLAVAMVDLTTLEGADTPERVRRLVARAARPWYGGAELPGRELPSCAAVCVYPEMVAPAAEAVAATGRPIAVASVATGFPSGQYAIETRLDDTKRAIEAGATEIDMVVSRGALLAGDRARVAREISAVKALCDEGGAHLKVILETGELDGYDGVRAASDLAIAALDDSPEGAEGAFIKTSTGKVAPAATMPVSLAMLEAVRAFYLDRGVKVGFKPAGGIRTAKDALRYLAMVRETMGVLPEGRAWLTPAFFRFGASSLLNDLVRQIIRQETGRYAAPYDAPTQ